MVPRLAIGLGAAGALTLGLHLILAGDTSWRPVRAVEVGKREADVPRRALPAGKAWLLYLVARRGQLPDAVRPVVEILPGGAMRRRRPPAPPERPGERPQWLAAGVVLPAGDLGELGPHERAALLEICRAWAVDRPEQIVPFGVEARLPELAPMIHWMR